MMELKPAPELVDSATDATASDPAPVEGQLAEAPTETPAPQTYKIGEEEYDSETLTDYISTAKNAKEMHRAAHERNTEAAETLKKVMEAQNDPKLRRLQYIIETIEQNPELAGEWRNLERTTFDRNGAPTNNLALAAQMREIRAELDSVRNDKAVMQADDYLGEFAAAKGITKEQAEEVGAQFLVDTSAEDFPTGAPLVQQLNYYYWDKYERDGAQAKLTAAKAAGYGEAIAKVKAGHAAELGSPASQAEVPWTPPKGGSPNMMASEIAAMEDAGLVFDDDPFN